MRTSAAGARPINMIAVAARRGTVRQQSAHRFTTRLSRSHGRDQDRHTPPRGRTGCAAEMAAAYGDHPEAAAQRMRWARNVVDTLFQPAVPAAPTFPRRGVPPVTEASATFRIPVWPRRP